MVRYFPIVCIGPEITMKELREKRPFLGLVISAICTKNLTRQVELGRAVRRVLGTEILLEGTKSLDLLLGLLVFASWGHFFILSKPIISTVIQLSISLAFDLELTKAIPTEQFGFMMNFNQYGCPKPLAQAITSLRTMEERRAVIGLFLVSSV